MKKLLLPLILLGIAGLAIGLYMYFKPVTSMHRIKADHQLGAMALYEAFDQDETAAMGTYAGKILEVTGEISEVDDAGEAGINIGLEAGGLMGGVRCRLDPGEKAAAQDLAPGQTVTLRGQCDGKLMDVELSRCVLVKSTH